MQSSWTRFVEVIEVPLTARPQRISVWLGDREFALRLYWCKPLSTWVIDIGDIYGNPIANGIPLVTGADLFEQFQYTELRGGRLVVMSTDRPPETVPGWGDLGVTGHVYWRRRPDVGRGRIWSELSAYGTPQPARGGDGSVAARLALAYRQE